MKTDTQLIDDFKKLVGTAAEPEEWEVEKGHIRRHADAVGDPNPIFRDIDYARESRHGNMIAPPFYCIDNGLVRFVDRLVEMAPHKANINGGIEIEFFKPMVVGDTITTVAKLIDAYAKEGKSGDLIFLKVEVTYTNQKEELVAVCRNTFIRR